MTKGRVTKRSPDDKLAELAGALRELAVSLTQVAESIRAHAQASTVTQVQSPRQRQPVITRISQATYDRQEREARETGTQTDEIPGFRRH